MPTEQCPHNPLVLCSNTVMKDSCKTCGIYKAKLKRIRQMRRTKVKREKEKKNERS